jgi:hypothetical protein
MDAYPLNVAVMLNVTDAADGFLFNLMFHNYFIMYNQMLALSVSPDLLWHVSCDLPVL